MLSLGLILFCSGLLWLVWVNMQMAMPGKKSYTRFIIEMVCSAYVALIGLILAVNS